jgi:hypothetical protein
MSITLFLQPLLDWLLADPSHVVAIASALAALIPTPSTTSVWGKLYKIIDLLALNILHAKEHGDSQPPSSNGTAPAVMVAATLSACSGQSALTTLFETRAAYDATVLTPLVRYHALPVCPVDLGLCKDPQVDKRLIEADQDAKTALDGAEDIIRFHPGIDPASVLYDAQKAVTTVQTILTNQGVQ